MPPFGPSIFVLGLFVASLTANEMSTVGDFTLGKIEFFNEREDINSTTSTPLVDNNATLAQSNASISMDTSTVNVTNNITIPSTTMQTSAETSTLMTSIMSSPAPKSAAPETTVSTTKAKGIDKTPPARQTSGDSTGIIILVVIILVALGFGVVCYISRKRARRYSVDFNSRPDDANIPLSTMDPDAPLDSAPQNGLQTFESVEIVSKDPQEAEDKEGEPEEGEALKTEATPDAQEEQKSEADKSAAETSSPDKPKEDVVEPSPPAPVEPSAEEKTDDEGAVSNKTSVESLKDANENNSNNAELSQQRDLQSSSVFWDVPLDCPV